MPKASLDILVGGCNGTPGFKINDFTLIPNELSEGEHTIDFTYEYGESIKFTMFGKSKYDVELVNGKIVKDKYIAIKKLSLEFLEIESWQFHTYFWQPYFGFNNQSKYINIPLRKDIPMWFLEISG